MTNRSRLMLLLAVAITLLASACGGGGSNSSGGSTTTGTGGGTGGGSTIANSVTLTVDAGPASLALLNEADEDLAFISISLCAPGSTTNCQTIDHVQVDTGSQGLRIPTGVLNSAVQGALQQQSSGSPALPVSECVSFGDLSFIWGPVMSADIQIAGEVAKSVPIQLASSAAPPAGASNAGCLTDQTGQIVTVGDLGANAILGLGLFRQDCGGGCALAAGSAGNPGMYFTCNGATCNAIAEPVLSQLQNPVWMFPQDNNGVVVQLPVISASGQALAVGNLFFGIGTHSNNAVGSAVPIQPDIHTGNFGVQFPPGGTLYNDCQFPGCTTGEGSSFIDSGSNGIFFLDAATIQAAGSPTVQDCPTGANNSLKGFYCLTNPQQPPTFHVSLFSENSSTGNIIGSPRAATFSIADAQTLFNSQNFAFNNVGGPNPKSFDFGLPFFFGQTIFFGIEGQSVTFPSGPVTGPIYAF